MRRTFVIAMMWPLFACSPKIDGWGQFKFGDTLEQVKTKQPGTWLYNPNNTDEEEGISGQAAWEDMSANPHRVNVGLANRAVYRISVTWFTESCDSVRQGLIKKYGKTGTPSLTEPVWHLGTAVVRYTPDFAGYCGVEYLDETRDPEATASKTASSSTASPARAQAPEAQDAPRKFVVSANTAREVSLIMQKVAAEYQAAAKAGEQRADETTDQYHQRLRKEKLTPSLFAGAWRTFTLDGTLQNALTRFVREHRSELSFEWECKVFDVRQRVVLCSVTSADDWDYSVSGWWPSDKPLRKGMTIKFNRFDSGTPDHQDPLRIVMYQPEPGTRHMQFTVLSQ